MNRTTTDRQLEQEIRYLKEHAQLPTHRILGSTHPVLGRGIIAVKGLIRRLIRFYVDPIAAEQSDRNAHMARALELLQRGETEPEKPESAGEETDPEAFTGRDILRDNQMDSVELKADGTTALEPAFSPADVAVLMVASDSFACYLGVLIQSIVAHASPDRTYDLVVMENDLSVRHMNQLTALAREQDHISIRFLNVAPLIPEEQLKITGSGYNCYTYYRLLAPHLMRRYEKVLYLDADVLAHADVAELFDTDVTGYDLAGTYDITVTSWQSHSGELRQYLRGLGLTEPGTYLQAGVILFNIAEMNRRFGPRELMERACREEYLLNDQDLLNVCCKGRIRYVGLEWNVFVLNQTARRENERYLPEPFYQEYTRARANPRIIHYTEKQFPDRVPEGDMAELYWHYARQTPFYEMLRG